MKSVRITTTVPAVIADKLRELLGTGLFGQNLAGVAREFILRGVRENIELPQVCREVNARRQGRKG